MERKKSEKQLKHVINKNLKKNNPGADRPVCFWFKIPAENHVYPWARRRVQGPTDIQT